MICLIAIFLLSMVTYVFPEPISIPLQRLQSPLKILLANSHHAKYKEIIHHLENLRNSSSDTVPLFKFLDYEFYGEVLIGHPGQSFKVVFDTSWGDLWVPSILCPIINIACVNRNKYDSSKSSTYKPTGKKFNLGIGNHNLSGMISSDLVHIGKVNITEQTFGEVSYIPWMEEIIFSKADGIFGLGFSSVVDGITPFFVNMMKQKVIEKNMFSFYFNRDSSTSKGGALLLGGIDQKHYRGNFTYVRVDSKRDYWEIPVDGISLKNPQGDIPFCKGGCKAILDSSTNEIRGPFEEIKAINGLLKARRFFFNKFIIDCGRATVLPHVTIKIANKDMVLKGVDFVQKMSYGPITICMSSFTPYDNENDTWTFGGAFMSQFYTVFDVENLQVGFATAR